MEKLQHCLRWKRSPDLAENAGAGVFCGGIRGRIYRKFPGISETLHCQLKRNSVYLDGIYTEKDGCFWNFF